MNDDHKMPTPAPLTSISKAAHDALAVPTATCAHSTIAVGVNVVTLAETNVKFLEVKAACADCKMPMAFRGVPYGVKTHSVVDEAWGTTVRLPMAGERDERNEAPILAAVVNIPGPKSPFTLTSLDLSGLGSPLVPPIVIKP